jgi:2-hydroxychromene-2-carboxylate isomerase
MQFLEVPMWRDIERRAAMYGIQASLPAPYPAKQSIVANLVATVGMHQGWGADFVKAAYRRWFQLGQETGSEPALSESLREIGQDPSQNSLPYPATAIETPTARLPCIRPKPITLHRRNAASC